VYQWRNNIKGFRQTYIAQIVNLGGPNVVNGVPVVDLQQLKAGRILADGFSISNLTFTTSSTGFWENVRFPESIQNCMSFGLTRKEHTKLSSQYSF
jgi:hypothetical protein